MFLLAADMALFERLTGAPLDAQGRPVLGPDGRPKNRSLFGPPNVGRLPSYGMRIPAFRAPYTGEEGLTSQNPSATKISDGIAPHGFRQVPVFDENVGGRKYADIWPAVTFQWTGLDFNPVTQLFGLAMEENDPSVPLAEIKNAQGDVVARGSGQKISRPLPDEWDLTYQITVWSKNSVEFRLLCQQVIYTLPPRGALEVQLQDGSAHACDFLLLRSSPTATDASLTAAPGEQRQFGMAFVYQLETYVDNSQNAYGIEDNRTLSTIQERLLTMNQLQSELVTPEVDLNAMELALALDFCGTLSAGYPTRPFLKHTRRRALCSGRTRPKAFSRARYPPGEPPRKKENRFFPFSRGRVRHE